MTNDTEYEPTFLLGLRWNYTWLLKTNGYLLSYNVLNLNNYSVDACKDNTTSSNRQTHEIPEGLECAHKILGISTHVYFQR